MNGEEIIYFAKTYKENQELERRSYVRKGLEFIELLQITEQNILLHKQKIKEYFSEMTYADNALDLIMASNSKHIAKFLLLLLVRYTMFESVFISKDI